jgi:CIC family chloride channel protein
MRSKYLGRFLIWRVRHISNRNFILFLSAIIGVGAGLIALLLKTSVLKIKTLFVESLDVDTELFWLIFYPIIGILLTFSMRKYIFRNVESHSVSAILYAISKRNSLMRRHKILSSIFGGALTAGFGGSIGLESPIISSGAALGSNLSRELHLSYKEITLLLACGAAGGIAAIFSTPIAAIVFALEVLLIDLSRFSLIPLLVASSSGAVTSKILHGSEFLFNYHHSEDFKIYDLFFFILFGILIGLMAIYFTKVYIKIENYFGKIVNPVKRIVLGGIVIGLLVFIFPALYGEGFQVIRSILSLNYQDIIYFSLFKGFREDFLFIVLYFSILAIIKVVATSVTISAGGIGGIFAPSLYVGAISGFLYAFIFNSLGFEYQLSVVNFTLIGMSAMLGGVIHAPLTGIFLIAEVTGGYNLIVPLMICTTTSYITVKAIYKESIFTYQLSQRGELITHNKDKAVLTLMRLKSLIETDLEPIQVSASLRKLVENVKISKRNIFPVLNEESMLVGIILLDDIREIMFKPEHYDTVYARNLMHLPPTYITTEDDMNLIMKKFKETGAWNLPVIEKGKYLGFVSKSKIFEAYRKLLQEISSE